VAKAYTDAEIASVYVVLTTNEGNVKRTARDTGVPENTVRRWKKKWESEGPPQLDEIEQVATDMISEAERVRDLALRKIEDRLREDKGTLAQIVTAYGVLTDKIDRARGIGSSHHHEHKLTLPSPDEIRATLGALVEGVQAGHAVREDEIEDAEIIEQPALLPGK